MFHRKKLRYCETKDNQQKIVTLLISKTLLKTRTFSKHKRFPYEHFRYSETNNSIRKSRYTPLLLKEFQYLKLVKQWRVLPRKLLVLSDKNYSTESRDTRSIPKNFDTKTLLKHEKLWYCETKIFEQKFVIYPYQAQKFSIPEISGTLNGSSAKSFGSLRKKSSTKSWYSWHTKNFWYRSVSETLKVSLRLFLVLWDKKNFNRKSWFILIMLKIFRYPKLVQHRGVPPRSVSVPCEKEKTTKSW